MFVRLEESARDLVSIRKISENDKIATFGHLSGRRIFIFLF